MTDHVQALRDMVAADAWMMERIRVAAAHGPPGGWLSAGFVRNKVWDVLHGKAVRTPLNDIDLIYFDPGDTSRETEWAYEAALGAAVPDVTWEVRNQARMHRKHGDPTYRDLEHALFHWLETVTPVGVRLKPLNDLEVLAVFGLDDVFNLVVRPTPVAEARIEAYAERMRRKNWRRTWPRLRILGLPGRA